MPTKHLIKFLLERGLQLSTVLMYKPELDICSKSMYIKDRRRFIDNLTIQQIFTSVATKKIESGSHRLKKSDKYYTLADLKYDLDSKCVVPLLVEGVLTDNVVKVTEASIEAIVTNGTVKVATDFNVSAEITTDTDDETETDEE